PRRTSMPANLEVINTVRELSRYFRDHPNASDTSEGISQWWIEADGQRTLAVVEAALDGLERCCVVEAIRAVDGRVRYRRRTDISDIQARLEALVLDPHAVFQLAGLPPPARPS